MKQKKIIGLESLKKIKILMNYDSKKTLSEQTQTTDTISDIAQQINFLLTGDVEGEDLDQVKSLLDNDIFGKTVSRKDRSECRMLTLLEYYQKASGNVTLKTIFGTGAFWTLGFSDWGRVFSDTDLIQDLRNADEYNEENFEEKRDNLVELIENELNGFCKKTTPEPETPKDFSLIKTWMDKFPCLLALEAITGTEKPKKMSGYDKYSIPVVFKLKNQLKTFIMREDGRVFNTSSQITKYIVSCESETKPIIKKDTNISDSVLKKEIIKEQEKSLNIDLDDDNVPKKKRKGIVFPNELKKTPTGVLDFQNWLIAKGYGGELGPKQNDNKFGTFTNAAWIKHKDEYLKNPSVNTESEIILNVNEA